MIAILGRISMLIVSVVTAAILIALVIMLTSNIASSIHGAPFVPVRRRIIRDLLRFGGLGANDVFYDLGSGDGRVLVSAAEDFYVRTVIGYEVTLWPFLESSFNLWWLKIGDKVKVYRRNFFKSGFCDATFIYLYLFPKLVDTLAAKISAETKSGTKILSVSFPINLESHRQFRLLKTQNFGKITAYLYEKI